jgi:hypothetical protein
MEKCGNAAAAIVWEASLSPAQRLAPDCADAEREEFIRNKYVRCRWIADGGVEAYRPPTANVGGGGAQAMNGVPTAPPQPLPPLDLFDLLGETPAKSQAVPNGFESDPFGLDILFPPQTVARGKQDFSASTSAISDPYPFCGGFLADQVDADGVCGGGSKSDPFGSKSDPSGSKSDPFGSKSDPFADLEALFGPALQQ